MKRLMEKQKMTVKKGVFWLSNIFLFKRCEFVFIVANIPLSKGKLSN
jgi:hypothetical protein